MPDEHVMVVLFVAVHVTGLPEQLIVVAPVIVRSFAGRSISLVHEADPAGTMILSPVEAALTQSLTSVRDALAAVRVGLEPEQAAADGRGYAHTASRTNRIRRAVRYGGCKNGRTSGCIRVRPRSSPL